MQDNRVLLLHKRGLKDQDKMASTIRMIKAGVKKPNDVKVNSNQDMIIGTLQFRNHELGERIHDISYIHVFGCPVFIHNHKGHLGKFDAKADDGYFLGYSFVSNGFESQFITRDRQVEEIYHGDFDARVYCLRCKISVQSKGITSNCCKKNPQVPKGIPTLGLYYPKCLGFDLKGYPDSDYAGCNINKKSTLGACQITCWKNGCECKRTTVQIAMSSAEAKYVAAAGCCESILWMKSQLSDYDNLYKMVPIFCDNTSAIAISNNPVLHSRTKHIDIRYHFIRDHILKGDFKIHFIPTEYQLADIFTKPLDEPTFTRLKAELGMLNID
ncbi:hypothetical protein Tco_0908965 [Tanacetum coccineum]|uniref:Retroviral polymerase SH3-like domain-containing protein n=1 Tax=Tanacetum coccineum TaxID=301880 RepID=A0ABQ5CPQ5_9ASTR